MEYLTKNGLAVLCWGLIFLGVLFLLIGCGPIYKSLGFTDVEAEEQVAKDKAEIIDAIENSRAIFWQTVSGALAGLGAIVSGLLGKWLSTERKVSSTLIKGIETAKAESVKETVHKLSVVNGVEKTLAKRVDAIT